ncbi:cleavage stimulation factor subunit 77-like isoform X2 [Gossypium hirsutum]|uniref:Cleavage stimulation factor subunit 77-like isoform X2 n=1 Tax=Gossypium hirsutum TaxID=3635 RepID=A0A1U8PBK5_GOSHI|nr:cleavage stimulation factor subunit 77-like isoform X2 [Gossypium hirsutum]
MWIKTLLYSDVCRYADFLSCLNDDRNIRALFERALSSLPQEESIEIWKRFTQFEKTYGDLASMLKVEQRWKEALSGTIEEGASALETSLLDLISRYSFKDLWPCSSKDLDHLSRQEFHQTPLLQFLLLPICRIPWLQLLVLLQTH